MNKEITYLFLLHKEGGGLVRYAATFPDSNKLPMDLKYFGEPEVQEFIHRSLPPYYEKFAILEATQITGHTQVPPEE